MLQINKNMTRDLIKTTSTIATVLSSSFRIRNGYEAVNKPRNPLVDLDSKPIIVGATPEAKALRAFFDSQDGHHQAPRRAIKKVAITIRDDIKVGSVVTVTLTSSAQTSMLLVISRTSDALTGAVLVTADDTLLHGVLATNELFPTAKRATVAISRLSSVVDPNTVVLRYAWNGSKPAFLGLNEWAQTEHNEARFHEGDLVFLSPPDGTCLLQIVQVHRMRNTDVVFRRLQRQEVSDGFRHDRLLVPAPQLERMARVDFRPIAKCTVSLLDQSTMSWTSDACDLFVNQDSASLLRPECFDCTMFRRQERRKERELSALRSMELMCGAGGLSLGLDLSGSCETKFAVDADKDSTVTFRHHHPSAQIFCCDAGYALQLAVSGRKSQEGIQFPKRGEVDVISAGPPCQGFSRMNQVAPREAAEKDPRNLLVATVLGWVDYLRPKYLILENVEGFTISKLGGHSQGMVKFTFHTLMLLGYGVTCGYVQSAAHGSPQSRKRFILIAARNDLTLPCLPEPTHHFLGKGTYRYTWQDAHGESHTAEALNSAAMLPAITVSHAISDLQAFDWRDPHQKYAGPDLVELERKQRGIPQVAVQHGHKAGEDAVAYAFRPLNTYQERMRVLNGQSLQKVKQHQTCGLLPHQVERVVNVAMYPGANYDSWSTPSVNKPALLGQDQVSHRLRLCVNT